MIDCGWRHVVPQCQRRDSGPGVGAVGLVQHLGLPHWYNTSLVPLLPLKAQKTTGVGSRPQQSILVWGNVPAWRGRRRA
ncbi:hypothetical protein NDU88_010656 [Pleurodeles waltl]|uniref:Uncharacterized protein n=1 Tax=Pleurodeles waltl TaxID=8319 RepID=A0AAV7QV04_PLEWA|nr:hypothetical protein NDU88_010656 [Pleurodeles waltl]